MLARTAVSALTRSRYRIESKGAAVMAFAMRAREDMCMFWRVTVNDAHI